MKKLLKSLVPLAIVLTVGCSKKEKEEPKPKNCFLNALIVTDASFKLLSENNKENCENYKKAVRDHIKSCSSEFTAAEKKDYEKELAEPCPK